MKFVGHCGRIFGEFETCEDWGLDDLCVGCPYNDEEEDELEDTDIDGCYDLGEEFYEEGEG